MKTFEITIYNEEVRESVRTERTHPNYDDGWADQRFLQIEGKDLDDVKETIKRRYPKRRGFVVVEIMELPNFS
ncbi:MAG: hypothetical protein KAI89_05920 [Emcibacter sp.]|nr:hypothetical protein [Emcibacter sp.]